MWLFISDYIHRLNFTERERERGARQPWGHDYYGS